MSKNAEKKITTIQISVETKTVLNTYRMGGETWDAFFRRILRQGKLVKLIPVTE